MFRLSVKKLIVLDPVQIPMEHCSVFSYSLIVNEYVKLFSVEVCALTLISAKQYSLSL